MYELKPVLNDVNAHSVTLVIGRVLRIHINEGVMDPSSSRPAVDWTKLLPMARLGGDTYGLLGSSFDLPRPDRK